MTEKIEMFMARKNKDVTQIVAEELSLAQQPEKPIKKRIHQLLRGQKTLKILLGIVFIALIGISIYYYHQYQKLKADPNAVAQEEMKTVTTEVSKIMELPQGEDPTVATVSDESKLKDQEFFQNAQDGRQDSDLYQCQRGIRILYRPSANKIINVAPLVMDQSGNN